MNKKLIKNITTISFYATIGLMVFLPFSSWLVSLSGSSTISLVRDILVLTIFVTALLLNPIKKIFFNDKISIILWALVFWGILTILWGDASIAQWLKGFRFIYLPIIMFIALRNITFNSWQKRAVMKVAMAVGIGLGLVALLELFGLNLPLTSSLSGANALSSSHFVGDSIIQRLQAVLAGPNALGLYMLALFGLGLNEYKYRREWYSTLLLMLFGGVLFFTYSRSALVGLIMMLIIALFVVIKERFNQLTTYLMMTAIIIIVGAGGYLLYSQPSLKVFVSHDSSSSLRVEQLDRIWDTKYEIGLWGRGLGNAGPASQNRLDNGSNHWTENVYLDIFEDIGLVGLILYLTAVILLIGATVRNSYRNINMNYRYSALLIGVSYAVIGLFINYYTGQVGIFILWLVYSLSLNQSSRAIIRQSKKRIARQG